MVNIYNVPVYNFSGWMLILGYSAIFLLLGRWWFKRSGYRPVVGYIYPFLMILLALITLITPLSQFLLWLGPIFQKGTSSEWIMLSVHILLPLALLILFWRGRMRSRLTLKDDLPLLAVIGIFHLSDILFATFSGLTDVLWLVALTSIIHWAILGVIWFASQKAEEATALYEP